MAKQYFIHSLYSHASNNKERYISDYFRSLNGCLLTGEPDQELLREVKSRVNELNEEFPRARKLDVNLHVHLAFSGYVLAVGNGTGNSVTQISIQEVISSFGNG